MKDAVDSPAKTEASGGKTPSTGWRCARLNPLRQRIDRGERFRLFRRIYRAQDGAQFEMIEASETPGLETLGYPAIGEEGFIQFTPAKNALHKLMEKLECR